MNDKIKIFLVDDDAVFLKMSEIAFRQHDNFAVETYPTGELCISNLSHNPDIVILDYYLDGIDKHAISGLETLDKIKKYNSDILVIMLSAQNKMDVALDCMQHCASDYVMKNKTAFERLPHIIDTIFNFKRMEKGLSI